jgi:PhnB protein
MPIEIVPNLSVSAGSSAVEFYKEAFGAVELFRVGEGENIFAELEIEGARIFVAMEWVEGRNFSPTHLGGTSVRIDFLCDDPDAVHARALAAGATEVEPVQDHEVGPRMGVVLDPFGHKWLIGRHWTGRGLT